MLKSLGDKVSLSVLRFGGSVVGVDAGMYDHGDVAVLACVAVSTFAGLDELGTAEHYSFCSA